MLVVPIYVNGMKADFKRVACVW